MLMMIDTYKNRNTKPAESKLAKAYKEGSYQASLDALLNNSAKNKSTLFKKLTP